MVVGDRARDVRRFPTPQLPSGARSSWATAARCCSACCMAASTIVVGGRRERAVQRSDVLLLRTAVHPARSSSVCRSSTPRSRSCAAPHDAHRLATADKDHLHHRLMRLGHGHRRSVLILWAWTAILSGFVLYPTFARGGRRDRADRRRSRSDCALYIAVPSRGAQSSRTMATTARVRRPAPRRVRRPVDGDAAASVAVADARTRASAGSPSSEKAPSHRAAFRSPAADGIHRPGPGSGREGTGRDGDTRGASSATRAQQRIRRCDGQGGRADR